MGKQLPVTVMCLPAHDVSVCITYATVEREPHSKWRGEPITLLRTSAKRCVVGRGVLLIGQGLDGRADGWDIREEGDVEGFGGTRALFVPGNIGKMLTILL